MDKISDRIQAILKEILNLADNLVSVEPLLDGYLYCAKIRCGKRSCRCMTSSAYHETWCISYTEGGKSRTRTIPLESLAVVRRMTGRYRRLRVARSSLVKLSQSVLDLVDSQAEKELVSGRRIFKEFMDQKRIRKKKS